MKTKLYAVLVGALALATMLVAAPGARAACSEGSSRTVDDPATEENEDTPDEQHTVEQTGTVLYGDFTNEAQTAGYAGATGNVGYLEFQGDGDAGSARIHGNENGGRLNGSIGTGGVCVNETQLP